MKDDQTITYPIIIHKDNTANKHTNEMITV